MKLREFFKKTVLEKVVVVVYHMGEINTIETTSESCDDVTDLFEKEIIFISTTHNGLLEVAVEV